VPSKTLMAAACLALPLCLQGAVDRHGLERYQVILDRKPFGAVAVPTAAMASPIAAVMPAPAIAKEFRLGGLFDGGGFDPYAGFVNVRSKQSYYLRVGEDQDGLRLLDVDFEKDGALVEKDGQRFWLYLDSAKPAAGVSQTMAAAGGSRAAGLNGPRASAAANRVRAGSYADRLRKRNAILEERRKKAAERASIGPEALQHQIMEYQMDLIRAGGAKGPPLPIPLTKEMDDQLVAEGVLPPQE
jgi:hypothetical protein